MFKLIRATNIKGLIIGTEYTQNELEQFYQEDMEIVLK